MSFIGTLGWVLTGMGIVKGIVALIGMRHRKKRNGEYHAGKITGDLDKSRKTAR